MHVLEQADCTAPTRQDELSYACDVFHSRDRNTRLLQEYIHSPYIYIHRRSGSYICPLKNSETHEVGIGDIYFDIRRIGFSSFRVCVGEVKNIVMSFFDHRPICDTSTSLMPVITLFSPMYVFFRTIRAMAGRSRGPRSTTPFDCMTPQMGMSWCPP